MRLINLTLLALILLAATGCPGPNVETPEGAYRVFYKAVVEKDWDRAVTFLPARHLDTFRQVGRRLGKAVGKQGDPLDFFLRGVRGQPVVPLRAVEVVSRGDQTAVLRIVAGPCGKDGSAEQCSVSEVTLRRTQGHGKNRRQARGWELEPEMPQLLSGGGG